MASAYPIRNQQAWTLWVYNHGEWVSFGDWTLDEATEHAEVFAATHATKITPVEAR